MNKCPVCGYSGLDKPAYNGFGNPSFDICDCCGTQSGYHDHSTSFAVLRTDGSPRACPGIAGLLLSRPVGTPCSS